MPAIALLEEQYHELTKRKNFAAKEPGVIVVFCIVGIVGIFLILVFINGKVKARSAKKGDQNI